MGKIDLARDSSLYWRFHGAVTILATETGSLNKRLHLAWKCYLSVFSAKEFPTERLQKKFKKLDNYLRFNKGYTPLPLHWKRSKECAEIIWDIYQEILKARKMDSKTSSK
ncbi:MAG: hypothetical protein ACTSXQ_08105 [Alphaproteobacteria bacterium]